MVLNVFLPFLVLIGDSGATSVPAFFVGETAAFPVVLGSNVLCTVEFLSDWSKGPGESGEL